ncbi:RICIN domain-containing protein [Paractinoplanes rishiriensis]|uniref:RICIN domain-containing protein n=1 Tax=Paractinoplanes rishiriensis TaxID=1050105 RepID=UPI001EF198FD|nr:RICIN domain-containing protein [Actinoplanes rishiriensis]
MRQWQVVATGAFAQLRPRHSGKHLDVNAWSTVNGGNIQQRTCNGANNQLWSFAAA